MERAALKPRKLQEVGHQFVHRHDDVVAAFEELARHSGVVNVAHEDQVEVAAQPGQRRSQLVGDRGDEPRALDVLDTQPLQFLHGPSSSEMSARAVPA